MLYGWATWDRDFLSSYPAGQSFPFPTLTLASETENKPTQSGKRIAAPFLTSFYREILSATWADHTTSSDMEELFPVPRAPSPIRLADSFSWDPSEGVEGVWNQYSPSRCEGTRSFRYREGANSLRKREKKDSLFWTSSSFKLFLRILMTRVFFAYLAARRQRAAFSLWASGKGNWLRSNPRTNTDPATGTGVFSWGHPFWGR